MRRRASLVIVSLVLTITAGALAGCGYAPRASDTIRLPGTMQNPVLDRCLNRTTRTIPDSMVYSFGGTDPATNWADVGSAPDLRDWHVHATDHEVVLLPRPDQQTPIGDDLETAVVIARAIVDCMHPFTFTATATFPGSRAGLLQLYRYDVGVLWPCLADHGFDAGPAPTREQFMREKDAQAAAPLSRTDWSDAQFRRLVSAARFCPQVPAYLAGR